MTVETRGASRWITSLTLIIIGLLVLIEQYVESQWLNLFFLLILGGMFLLWGSMTRSIGLLIPGGILTGIGLGHALTTWPLNNLRGDAESGVMLLSFAMGWGIITLFSKLVTHKTHWWPLIPGGIIAIIGGALLLGGVAREALDVVGGIIARAWPFALIVYGLYLWARPQDR